MNNFSSTSDPLVSVVVPTYKRPELLLQALQSIKDQLYTRFECIVVNDDPNSNSEVDELVLKLDDSRFKVIHNTQSSGVTVTRNKGIGHSDGSIIAFLDDDDRWVPEYLQKHVEHYKYHPEVGGICSGLLMEWQENVLPKKFFTPKPAPPVNETQSAMLRGEFIIMTTSALSFRKNCIDEVGGFDENIPSMEDWELCYRIGEKFQMASISEPLTIYFQHLKYRETGNIEQRKKGVEALYHKYRNKKEFGGFSQKYIAQIHFASIKNNVLIGRNKWNRQLLINYVKQGTNLFRSRYQIKVTLKMIILVLLGKAGFKIINLF